MRFTNDVCFSQNIRVHLLFHSIREALLLLVLSLESGWHAISPPVRLRFSIRSPR